MPRPRARKVHCALLGVSACVGLALVISIGHEPRGLLDVRAFMQALVVCAFVGYALVSSLLMRLFGHLSGAAWVVHGVTIAVVVPMLVAYDGGVESDGVERARTLRDDAEASLARARDEAKRAVSCLSASLHVRETGDRTSPLTASVRLSGHACPALTVSHLRISGAGADGRSWRAFTMTRSRWPSRWTGRRARPSLPTRVVPGRRPHRRRRLARRGVARHSDRDSADLRREARLPAPRHPRRASSGSSLQRPLSVDARSLCSSLRRGAVRCEVSVGVPPDQGPTARGHL